MIDRDFKAPRPNEKWLTDITEFGLSDGKVYLSPIIDCFDGMPVTWTIGTSPDADLVNTMLDQAIAVLPPDAKPIVHSDRGCHYRWPGWIGSADKILDREKGRDYVRRAVPFVANTIRLSARQQ